MSCQGASSFCHALPNQNFHIVFFYPYPVWSYFVFRLAQIFEFAEDIAIDLPQLWKYLGEQMGPTAFDGNINLDELFKCVLKYVSKRKAAKLFAYMLQSATSDTVS